MIKLTDANWDWWEALGRVSVYPQIEGRMWESKQCDGCYEIMRPIDEVEAWIAAHYPHRFDMIKDLPFPLDEDKMWDTTSMHIRHKQIENWKKEKAKL